MGTIFNRHRVHALSFAGIHRREPGQPLVHGEQLVVGRRRGNVHLLGVQARRPGPAFGGQTAAGAIHEDVAHGLGGGGKEVLAPDS